MRHHWLRISMLAFACFAFTACGTDPLQNQPSDNNANNTPACPDGQKRNPINNTCEKDDNNFMPKMMPDPDDIPPWADDDNDAVIDRYDNCIGESNPDQMDGDADGWGDACDNCPSVANTDQDPNACMGDAGYDPNTDTDGDMVPDIQDNCSTLSNPDQMDNDGDKLGNACDNCPDIANYDQTDSDNNMVGDACEPNPSNIPICDRTESEFMKLDPNIYILLDRSGSMRNDSKMSKAKSALNTMADQLAGEVRFGLATYGQRSSCNAAQRLVMGSHSPQQIKNSYASIDAEGGTPTAQAIKDVVNNGWLDEPNDSFANVRPKAFVLITDGATGACGGDGGHNGAVQAVTQLFMQQGVKTYAVGFGSGASESQLRDLARAGGTMNFYRASDSNSLVNVLRTIANEVISCSYVLNQPPPAPDKIWVDINGNQVPREPNNGFSFDPNTNTVTINGSKCTELRGLNPATTKVQIQFGCATPCVPEGEEICDFKDNDCDGDIDEGCEGCGPEICDGQDNDCDDQIDEGCPACKLEDEMCSSDEDCCRKSCVEGICGPPCRPDNVTCKVNSDCCNGNCAKGAGQEVGVCISG